MKFILTLVSCLVGALFLTSCTKKLDNEIIALRNENSKLASKLTALADNSEKLRVQLSESKIANEKIDQKVQELIKAAEADSAERAKLQGLLVELLSAFASGDRKAGGEVLSKLTTDFPEIRAAVDKMLEKQAAEQQSKAPKVHAKEFSSGDGIFISATGKWEKNVWGVGYRKGTLRTEPWLVVMVSLTNQAKLPAEVPAFVLIDENGAIYAPAQQTTLIADPMRQGILVNPNAQKFGYLLFEVPKLAKFRLGFTWNDHTQLIEFETSEN